ncbi:MAG TPA: preprotein translocase subunit SecE [Lachnospiraceae bacterium]|nr:preprotein translocase subunit SecE [Lachnospiraceae bacterium]
MGENTKKKTPKKDSFLKGVQHEFKKVIWPDKNTLGKQTAAVVFVSVILGALISLVDIVAKYGIDLLVK